MTKLWTPVCKTSPKNTTLAKFAGQYNKNSSTLCTQKSENQCVQTVFCYLSYVHVHCDKDRAEPKGNAPSLPGSIYIPSLIYGHQLWVVTNRTVTGLSWTSVKFSERRPQGRPRTEDGWLEGLCLSATRGITRYLHPTLRYS